MEIKGLNIYEALRTVPRYRVRAVGMLVFIVIIICTYLSLFFFIYSTNEHLHMLGRQLLAI